MTAKPQATKPPKTRDPTQSKRFIAKAKELEAAGELSLTEAGKRFEAAFRIVTAAKSRKTPP